MNWNLKVGDVVSLKKRYHEDQGSAIIVKINTSEAFGDGGWISFDYVIMTQEGHILHVSETCIGRVISRQ